MYPHDNGSQAASEGRARESVHFMTSQRDKTAACVVWQVFSEMRRGNFAQHGSNLLHSHSSDGLFDISEKMKKRPEMNFASRDIKQRE